MSPRPRDSQKSKVFAVEDTLRQTLKPGDTDLRYWTAHIMHSAWFKRRATVRQPETVDVRKALNPGHCEFTRSQWSGYTLILGRNRFDKLGATHALAHMMAHSELNRLNCIEPSHGRTFARCFLELVKREWGNDTAKQLRVLYQDHRVKRIAVSEETREKRRASWEQRQIVEAKSLWSDFIQEKEES